MKQLAQLIQDYRTDAPNGARPSGVSMTEVPGVMVFWDDVSVPRSPLLYDAGLVILGSGQKVGYLGERRFVYDANTCLALGVPVPFECEAHASADEPLLGLRVDIDVAMLHKLVARFQSRFQMDVGEGVQLGVAGVPLEGSLLTAVIRLMESLRDPMDAHVLGAAAVDEIIYRVFRSEAGRVLYALTQQHTAYASIAQALMRIHRDYKESLSVEELAQESAMSVSSFHRAFKEVTNETPLQYLKKIRLLKAKGLLVFEGARVDEAAYDVGYVSPSQFSREFKRYFSVPPSQAATLPYSNAI